MQKRYPFPFLDAYEREDRDFFFGRDEEIEQLYQLTQQSNIVLLYGHSGTGKTSLIRCGLANKFRSYDWQDVYVRRGTHLIRSLDRALCEESDGAFDYEDDVDTIADLPQKLEAVYRATFKPLYLIFDQFEELYVLGSRDEQDAFVRIIQEILRVEQPVKVILSIREEYLGHLYEFERAVPELLRKKLRVEPMNLERVKTVLLGVSNQPDSNVQLEAGHEATIAEGIFEKIRGQDKTLHIPLPYLQVFLDKFYLEVTGDQSRQAEAIFTRPTLAAMGDLGDVLRNFLDEQATAISRAQGLPEAEVWRALSPFVTLEGTKEPLSEAQLTTRLSDLPTGASARLLQALVQGRILRFSEAIQLYEVAHDALAKQIHARRSDEEIAILEVQRLVKSQTAMKAEAREYFTEKQLLFMEPYMEKLVLGEAEKEWIAESRAYQQAERTAAEQRQREELEKAQRQAEQERHLRDKAEQNARQARQRTRVAAIAFLFALLLAGAAGYLGYDANRQKATAEKATLDAKNALLRVEEEKAAKEEQRQKAEDNFILAEDNLKKAKAEEEKAKAALLLVEKEKAATEEQRQKAETNFKLAEAKTIEAEAERNKAAAERDKTQATLDNLEKANASTVELLLANAERDILNFHYEAALEKQKAAASLGALKPQVAAALLQTAFWYGEIGNTQRAISLLDSAAALVNKEAAHLKPFRASIEAFDPAVYKIIMERYYPAMVKVEGGIFEMGCDSRTDENCGNDETLHSQEVSSFQMAKYETTWWQYFLFCQVTGHKYESPSWGTPGDNPVVNVSWFDAVLYSNWVNNQLGLDTFYVVENKREGDYGDYYDVTLNPVAKKGYRLPTEAEWEYAAKGGPYRSPFAYAGSDDIDAVAWYSSNSGRTSRRGEKKANALGLYDMSGNVWEWCWDKYDDYPGAPEKDYAGPENGTYRVFRGGSWYGYAASCRTANRSSGSPDNRSLSVGFRLIFVPQ